MLVSSLCRLLFRDRVFIKLRSFSHRFWNHSDYCLFLLRCCWLCLDQVNRKSSPSLHLQPLTWAWLGSDLARPGASRSQTCTCAPWLRLNQGQVKPKSRFVGARLGLTCAWLGQVRSKSSLSQGLHAHVWAWARICGARTFQYRSILCMDKTRRRGNGKDSWQSCLIVALP